MRNTGDLVFRISDVETKRAKTKKGLNPLLILGTLVHFRSF
jgi:hypothetical protein